MQIQLPKSPNLTPAQKASKLETEAAFARFAVQKAKEQDMTTPEGETQLERLKDRIYSITFEKNIAKRKKMLKAAQWRMVNPETGGYAGLNTFGNIVEVKEKNEATVFSGMDSETVKLGFYRAITAIHWEVECAF